MKTLTVCPACSSSDVSFFYRGESAKPRGHFFDLWRCKECRHYFVNPQPFPSELDRFYGEDYEAYSRIKEHSDADLDREARTARETMRYRRLSLRPGMSVLDVGCGGGVFLNVLKRAGFDVQGIEPSPVGARNCKAQGLPVHHGNLTSYLAEHGTARKFDAITANHVFEHHPDPEHFLREMLSIIAPGGKIWIAVPNAGTELALSLRDKWYSLVLPIHLNHFNTTSAERLTKRLGVQATISTYSLPFVLWTTLKCYMRQKAYIPIRLTNLLDPIAVPLVAPLGRIRDTKGAGEEIVIEIAA